MVISLIAGKETRMLGYRINKKTIFSITLFTLYLLGCSNVKPKQQVSQSVQLPQSVQRPPIVLSSPTQICLKHLSSSFKHNLPNHTGLIFGTPLQHFRCLDCAWNKIDDGKGGGQIIYQLPQSAKSYRHLRMQGDRQSMAFCDPSQDSLCRGKEIERVFVVYYHSEPEDHQRIIGMGYEYRQSFNQLPQRSIMAELPALRLYSQGAQSMVFTSGRVLFQEDKTEFQIDQHVQSDSSKSRVEAPLLFGDMAMVNDQTLDDDKVGYFMLSDCVELAHLLSAS